MVVTTVTRDALTHNGFFGNFFFHKPALHPVVLILHLLQAVNHSVLPWRHAMPYAHPASLGNTRTHSHCFTENQPAYAAYGFNDSISLIKPF